MNVHKAKSTEKRSTLPWAAAEQQQQQSSSSSSSARQSVTRAAAAAEQQQQQQRSAVSYQSSSSSRAAAAAAALGSQLPEACCNQQGLGHEQTAQAPQAEHTQTPHTQTDFLGLALNGRNRRMSARAATKGRSRPWRKPVIVRNGRTATKKPSADMAHHTLSVPSRGACTAGSSRREGRGQRIVRDGQDGCKRSLAEGPQQGRLRSIMDSAGGWGGEEAQWQQLCSCTSQGDTRTATACMLRLPGGSRRARCASQHALGAQQPRTLAKAPLPRKTPHTCSRTAAAP